MKKWMTGLAVLILLITMSVTAMADIERQCNFCHTVTTGTFGVTEIQDNQHTFLYYCNKCGWPSAITEEHLGDSSATCSVSGTCSICEASYYDTDDHQWGSWQPAEDGKQHIRYCQYNSSHTDTEEHQADPTRPCTELQTCPVCNGGFYGPYNHEWSESCSPTEDGKQHYYVCLHDSSHIKLEDHTSVQPATCRDPQLCAECGASYYNPNNHPDEYDEIYTRMGEHGDPGFHIKILVCAYCKTEVSSTYDMHSIDPNRISYSDYDEDWHIEFLYCSKCKDSVIGNSRRHTFSEATCVVPPTCVCGRTNGDPDLDNHDWGDWVLLDNVQHIRTCQRDGCTQTEPEYHTGGEATTTRQAICEVCLSPYGGLVPDITSPTENRTVTVYEGERATMRITAKNAAAYQWYMSTDGGVSWTECGENSPIYTTSPAKLENNGYQYMCVVTGSNELMGEEDKEELPPEEEIPPGVAEMSLRRRSRSTDDAAQGEVRQAESPVFTLEVIRKDAIPQTGDSSHLMGWLALLGVCGAGMLCLNRRRK